MLSIVDPCLGIEVPEGRVRGKRRKERKESKVRERKPEKFGDENVERVKFWIYDKDVNCDGINWPQDFSRSGIKLLFVFHSHRKIH